MFNLLTKVIVVLAVITTTYSISGCTQKESNSSSIDSAKFADDAHWLEANIIALDSPTNVKQVTLHSTLIDGMEVTTIFRAVKLPARLSEKFPHLSHLNAFESKELPDVKRLLKSKNRVIYTPQGSSQQTTKLQQYGAIDHLYTASFDDADEINDFGASVLPKEVQFKLWAPTAVSVNVLLFDKNKQPLTPAKLAMVEDNKTGTWAIKGPASLISQYYQYQLTLFHPATDQFETVTVTDPYSLSLSRNSKYSQIVDLTSVATKPLGWDSHSIPTVEAPEDLILYETHIKDFSASDTALSNNLFKGKYKAFSETDSFGMIHLAMLKEAGLNTIHLLPTYDLSTINEDPSIAISLDDSMTKVCQQFPELSACLNLETNETLRQKLQSYDPRTGDAQALVEKIRGNDDYNWGYDPFHYTVPEGSYAVDPEGINRIVEFREMVQSLHSKGFRVIMDVVYNHTFASGLAEKSVLDKVVPGYYHRLNIKTGAIEQSTCCDNSATEHAMMAKLMKDSLVVWARDYKIDGFRFDLMGHQPKSAMLESRKAVQQVDSDTYFYGEGWNFGEVGNNAQFVQASQQELSGTEIGTFTDRLRDAIRGGNFQTNAEKLRFDQGIGNGLYVVPNEMQRGNNQQAHYNNSMDIVRLGLAANLKTFSFNNINGQLIAGTNVLYGGNPAGYASDPADTINYVSKHDNQTLWDNHQYRLPFNMTSDDRVRIQSQSLSYALLAQGIPFLHMGSELLRSKAFLRDSYDYGDWFNKVDFSYQTNNYDVGLPPAEKDQDNWPIISKILDKNGNNDDVSPAQIERSANIFADFIRIRTSSALFRLRTAEQINQNVQFMNTGPQHVAGLIVMKINDVNVGDTTKGQLDPNYDSIVVIFNNNATSQKISIPQANKYKLHPVQRNGFDDIVKQTHIADTTVTIPAYTTAVLVR